MGFKIDYNNTGAEPVKPGEYEVVPSAYDISTSTNGNQKVTFNYEIRSDVDQPAQGQEIRYDNFTVTDNAMWRFNQAAKAVGIPDGLDMDATKFAEAFKGKPLRVVVGEREYNGNKYPQVKLFKESEASGKPNIQNSKDDPFASDGKPIDISDDDLPF
jgi:single-stranded DNA-binding protein